MHAEHLVSQPCSSVQARRGDHLLEHPSEAWAQAINPFHKQIAIVGITANAAILPVNGCYPCPQALHRTELNADWTTRWMQGSPSSSVPDFAA